MDTSKEIQEKLEKLYQEYSQSSNHKLSEKSAKEVVELLWTLTFAEDADASELVRQMNRFLPYITRRYLERLTNTKDCTTELLDKILEEMIVQKAKKAVDKYPAVIGTVISFYLKRKAQSKPLLQMIIVTANSEKWFLKAVDSTKGDLYQLDYSALQQEDRKKIWEMTCQITPSKPEILSKIRKWTERYGFSLQDKQPKQDKQPEQAKPQEQQAEKPEVTSAQQQAPLQENTVDGKAVSETVVVQEESKEPMQQMDVAEYLEPLENRMQETLQAQQNAILTAMEAQFASLGEGIAKLQKKAEHEQVLLEEISQLKAQLQNAEQQGQALQEQVETLQKSQQEAREERTQLTERITTLEAEKTELDEKLKAAYALHNREDSMEAEKVRTQLQKAFAYLHEDWQEYENSQCNEENYESLQAILKKVFRALKRNGIEFQEDEA